LLELILGGARSGKSAFAERRARDSGYECRYIATAHAGDDEMAARIDHHRQRRSGFTRTIEEPLYLADVIAKNMADDRCLLVDCLTLWLTNLLLDNDPLTFERERAQLLELLPRVRGHIIFVSNEVGLGIVPVDPLSRRFVDESGRLHQQLAQQCDRVFFVVAGLAQCLKESYAKI
jgi:adenosylcobinamide kinase / adenosylcobinamide-phosphate guanylyltransferase